ncbi:MAG TPA: YggS family pyridoxal phosphate-dependent enzyme [Aquimonas sp.]|nr:YggS family pyridoxal phosphate-dependent enzyme [Aquimonas sp.]HRF54089.1 YggS family pyridoxal phosphate-dependent enzyme [Aquimonas sp.]
MNSDNPTSDGLSWRLSTLQQRIHAAAPHRRVQLLAVSKLQSPEAMRALFALGQRAFGENYVQEAEAKHRALADCADTEWHLIGHLQSNKAEQAARLFDWVHSIDRAKLIAALAKYRVGRPPLQVLIQVDIDDEDSKSGCQPDQVTVLAEEIVRQPTLCLRGLMSIPAPVADMEARRASFARLRGLFDALRKDFPTCDTLSMGMSEDFELAIAEGSTMVRVGSALFGARPT